MIHIFSDPKPHLPDSPQWTSILRHQIPTLNIGRRVELGSMLWTLRDMGTVIQNGKLVPLVYPGSAWESEQEFKDVTVHLRPFAAIIKQMIDKSQEAMQV